jgi:release factor glutamine methyltransferase
VSPADRRRFERLVRRRATGEPIPLIKGYAEFRGLELLVRPGVFVPRDASEFLAVQAMRRLRGRRRPVHVDLATGAGTIALAVANEVARVSVIGTDLSAEAVRLAHHNAERLGLRATFVTGDLFDGLPRRIAGGVDVITFHPPYVPSHEVKDLPEEIRAWEPVHTLTDHSRDGLSLIGRTAREAPGWLAPSGWLLLEVSSDRVGDVKRVLTRAGFRDVRSTKGGPIPITRVIVARRPR